MSQESVELVKRLLEMFARREHEAVFAFYDTNIEWDATSMGEEGPNPLPDDLQGIYHGHEGVRRYWRRWLQAWADIEFEVADVLDAGDDVVALIRNQRQWGRRSGIATDTPPVRWRGFSDTQSALKAVGLSE